MRKYGWHPVCVFSPKYPEPTSHMPTATVSVEVIGGRKREDS